MSQYSLVINGITLPTPTELTLEDYDISSSKTGRNAKGYMIIENVRRNVHSITAKWAMLKPDDYMTIRNAISGVYNLSTSYFIPEQNARGTILTYRGDRSTPVYWYVNGPWYQDFTLELVEM